MDFEVNGIVRGQIVHTSSPDGRAVTIHARFGAPFPFCVVATPEHRSGLSRRNRLQKETHVARRPVWVGCDDARFLRVLLATTGVNVAIAQAHVSGFGLRLGGRKSGGGGTMLLELGPGRTPHPEQVGATLVKAIDELLEDDLLLPGASRRCPLIRHDRPFMEQQDTLALHLHERAGMLRGQVETTERKLIVQLQSHCGGPEVTATMTLSRPQLYPYVIDIHLDGQVPHTRSARLRLTPQPRFMGPLRYLIEHQVGLPRVDDAYLTTGPKQWVRTFCRAHESQLLALLPYARSIVWEGSQLRIRAREIPLHSAFLDRPLEAVLLLWEKAVRDQLFPPNGPLTPDGADPRGTRA